MAGSERDSDHKLSIKPEFGTDGAEIALHSHFILSIAYNEPWFNISHRPKIINGNFHNTHGFFDIPGV